MQDSESSGKEDALTKALVEGLVMMASVSSRMVRRLLVVKPIKPKKGGQ